jgi:hypothetical protein
VYFSRKMSKEKYHHPMGENLPNLVTLVGADMARQRRPRAVHGNSAWQQDSAAAADDEQSSSAAARNR